MKKVFPVFGMMGFISLVFISFSYAQQYKKVIKSNQKQEVSAIYKECLQQKHGIMLNCIQKRVQELGEDIEVFDYSKELKSTSDWQAPEEYLQRKNTVPANEVNLKRGKEIYSFYCSACHGQDGRGYGEDSNYDRAVADLTNPDLLKKQDGAIFWKITEGSWPMPAFWEGDILAEEDFWVLIHYLRSLSYNKE